MQLPLRKLWIAALTAAVFALAAAAPSGAAGSITVAGSAVPTTTNLNLRTADGNTLFSGSGTHTWTGSLTGTSVIDVHFVAHPSGNVTYQGFLTFTGATPCGAGTVQIAGQATTIDQRTRRSHCTVGWISCSS